jgi:hypothetical protein
MSRLSRGRQLLRAELSDFAGTAAPQSMTALAG